LFVRVSTIFVVLIEVPSLSHTQTLIFCLSGSGQFSRDSSS